MVMTVTQHPKKAASLKKKMRQTPTAEPQMTAKAQVAALTEKVLAVMGKFQMMMARKKTLRETDESSSEAEESDAESSFSSSESNCHDLEKFQGTKFFYLP